MKYIRGKEITRKEYLKNSEETKQRYSLAEAKIAAALPLTTAKDSLSKSHLLSLRSPVTSLIRRAKPRTKLVLLGPNTPVVSTARGSKE